MGQWVKVEFQGMVPEGQRIMDVDITEVIRTLGRSFGFRYIDGLRISTIEREIGNAVPSLIDLSPPNPPYFEGTATSTTWRPDEHR